MKKVLFVMLALAAMGFATSCKKDCNCKESHSGYSTTVKDKTSSECSDYQSDLNSTASRYGYNQSWHCVSE